MKLEDIRKLHQRKHRAESGYFLLEGEHLVRELESALLREPRLRASEIYVSREYADWQSPLPVHLIGSRQMAQITETRTPQGIAAVAPMLAPALAPAGARAIYLHELQDPGNLGTILRTLAWFGTFRCLLGPGSVDPFNGKAVRASMGAILHVPVEVDVPLDILPARFSRIASLDLGGTAITTPEFAGFECYVYGSEGRGLPHAALAGIQARPFTIPGRRSIESLNVATAVSICQYELARAQS